MPTFRLQGGQWPQPGGDGSPVTITYSYNNLRDGGLLDPNGRSVPGGYIRRVIEEALGVWAEVAPLTFVEVEDQGGPVRISPYPNGQFGQIRFSHRFINGPDPPNGPPTTKAQAYFPTAGGNLAGDIFFDNGDPWAVIGELDKPDILGAAIHEIGHAIGLGHDPNTDANMNPVFTRHTGPGSGLLHFSDIAGARAIYGAGSGGVISLGVPEPSTLALVLAIGIGSLTRRHGRHGQANRIK